MDVIALRRQDWTIGQIADAVGAHPATISSWLKKGGPPPKRHAPAGHVPVIDERWAKRVSALLEANPELLGTSIERIIRAEGFAGSYESLVRHLRDVRGVRRRHSPGVSVPIETDPGAEFQFDWSDCCDWGETWGLGDLDCFGAVLCYSRRRSWWFAPLVDRAHTFEGPAFSGTSAASRRSVARIAWGHSGWPGAGSSASVPRRSTSRAITITASR